MERKTEIKNEDKNKCRLEGVEMGFTREHLDLIGHNSDNKPEIRIIKESFGPDDGDSLG